MDLTSKSLLLIVPLVLLVFTDVEAAGSSTTAVKTAAKPTSTTVTTTKASTKAAVTVPATGNFTKQQGNNSATRVYGITATLMTMMVLTISL